MIRLRTHVYFLEPRLAIGVLEKITIYKVVGSREVSPFPNLPKGTSQSFPKFVGRKFSIIYGKEICLKIP